MPRSDNGCRPARKKEVPSDITVVLLAGNPGWRMKSYGPQCLQKLSTGQTLLDKQVSSIRAVLPESEIIITCKDYLTKILNNKPYDVRVVQSQIEDSNEVEEIRLALNNTITDNVLFVCSDMYFDRNIFNSVDFNESFVLYETNNMMASDSVGVTIVNGKASIMSYGIDNKWARIFYVNQRGKVSLNHYCKNEQNQKMFAWEAVNYVVDKSSVFAYRTDSNLYCVENTNDIRKLKGMK